MRFYTFEVCRLINGTYSTKRLTIAGQTVGHALARIWQLSGYVSCQYIGRGYAN